MKAKSVALAIVILVATFAAGFEVENWLNLLASQGATAPQTKSSDIPQNGSTEIPSPTAEQLDKARQEGAREAAAMLAQKLQEASDKMPRSRTFSLMPGEAHNFANHEFRYVEVRSTFPLRVYTGSCRSDYTVEFVCNGDPSDIFIVDVRPRPLLFTPKANEVTITVRRE